MLQIQQYYFKIIYEELSRKLLMMHIPKLKKFHYILLAFLLTLLYFALLMFYFEPAISTPDAQGYFSQAKLIAKEGHTYFEPESKLEYIGPHWLSEGNNRYYTTFPPGFPFILAIAYNIISPKASLLLNPLLASLSLFILFLLVSLLISDGWGLIAMLLFAINPIANEHSLFGDSHTIVIFFLILALLCLVKWIKTKSLLWICSAGFFFGIIPTIRYAETLFLFAFGIFILFHFQKNKTFWHSLIAATIGASIPLITLSIRNQLVFGAFWKTGYKVSSESSHFGLMYFLKYFLPYLQQLLFDGLGLIFLLGLIGFVYLCYQQKTRKIGFLFILLVFPITFLYMSYMWKPDPQSMRFLLPTFPIYIISTVWLLKIIINKYFRIGITISILLLFFSIIGGLSMSIMKMQHLKNNNAVLVKITNVIENEIERKSIIITNEAISQNLDFLGYWYLSDMSIFKANLDSSQICIPEHK